jgi:hypothetical protein
MMNYWNRFFIEAEEMVIDFCLYVSPFPMIWIDVTIGRRVDDRSNEFLGSEAGLIFM